MVKSVIFWLICLLSGTLLAVCFYYSIPYINNYFETRHFARETRELAALIKKYSKNHINYANLSINTFKTEELPYGIYKNINDIDLESTKGGKIHISGASSSRYKNDMKAFVINWFDVNTNACKTLVSQDWNVSGLRFLGLAVTSKREQWQEKDIYRGCNGAKYLKSAIACPDGKKFSFPLKKEDINKVCNCPNGQCNILLKYM